MASSYIVDGNIVLSMDDLYSLIASDVRIGILHDHLETNPNYISIDVLSLIVGYKAQKEVKKDNE